MQFHLEVYGGYILIVGDKDTEVEIHSNQGKKLYKVKDENLELYVTNPEDKIDGLSIIGTQVRDVSVHNVRCKGPINTSISHRS